MGWLRKAYDPAHIVRLRFSTPHAVSLPATHVSMLLISKPQPVTNRIASTRCYPCSIHDTFQSNHYLSNPTISWLGRVVELCLAN